MVKSYLCANRKMKKIMGYRHIAAVLLAVCWGVEMCGQEPLVEVERMTGVLMSRGDEHALQYDVPSWRLAVESQLCAATDSSLGVWEPKGLTRVGGSDGSVVWGGVWRRGVERRFVWIGVGDVGGRREGMAFVDEIVGRDSVYVVEGVEVGGLVGVRVRGESGEAYRVDDVRSRMAMRIMASSVERSDEEKDVAEGVLVDRLGRAEGVIMGELSGMPELMVCDSPDGVLRSVTYMISYSDFSTRCGGWMGMREKRGVRVERLMDATGRIGQPETAVLNAKSWYGALYTKMIQFRQGRKDYYALIGYKGADATTKTRVIDVVSEGEDGKLVFGASKPFIHATQRFRRRIYRYSINASMSIRYDEGSEMIVVDHLESNSRVEAGRAEFYGPDLSYDAYLLTDDGWKFQSDISVTVEEGAQPNEEGGSAADNWEMPQGRQPRASAGGTSPVTRPRIRRSKSTRWSGKSSDSYRRGSGKSGKSWFDKGKGNSAPNIRRR